MQLRQLQETHSRNTNAQRDSVVTVTKGELLTLKERIGQNMESAFEGVQKARGVRVPWSELGKRQPRDQQQGTKKEFVNGAQKRLA